MLQPGEYSSARRDAFSYCVSLESIQLPDSLEDIGYGLFSGNGNLEVIMTQEQKINGIIGIIGTALLRVVIMKRL